MARFDWDPSRHRDEMKISRPYDFDSELFELFLISNADLVPTFDLDCFHLIDYEPILDFLLLRPVL